MGVMVVKVIESNKVIKSSVGVSLNAPGHHN